MPEQVGLKDYKNFQMIQQFGYHMVPFGTVKNQRTRKFLQVWPRTENGTETGIVTTLALTDQPSISNATVHTFYSKWKLISGRRRLQLTERNWESMFQVLQNCAQKASEGLVGAHGNGPRAQALQEHKPQWAKGPLVQGLVFWASFGARFCCCLSPLPELACSFSAAWEW